MIFNRLTVISEDGASHWVCKCMCGTIKRIQRSHVQSGNTKSCGCLRREANHRKSHQESTKGGLYTTWLGMRWRCSQPSNSSYKYYGALGVRVCGRWGKYENFKADMGVGYRPGLSIDRIDPYGNYEPGNCRWATKMEQRHNRRINDLTK